MKLLVYIPSFNRAENLMKQLGVLKAYQGPDELEVVVQDNGSFESYEEVRRFCKESDFGYVRNPCNIGPNPNILAGFMYCSRTDYLWILSDDDLIKPDAVNKVFDLLHRHEGCDIVYLTHNLLQQEEIVELNQEQLLKQINDGLGVISQVIYRSAKVMPYIRAGYDNLMSCFPHLAILFELTKQESIIVCRVSKEEFFFEGHLPVSEPLGYQYSFYGFTLLVHNLKEELRGDFLSAWWNEWQIKAVQEFSQAPIHAAVSFHLMQQYVPQFSAKEDD